MDGGRIGEGRKGREEAGEEDLGEKSARKQSSSHSFLVSILPSPFHSSPSKTASSQFWF